MRMLWLGLLIVASLLLSFTGFIEADEETNTKEESKPDTKHRVLHPIKIIEHKFEGQINSIPVPEAPPEDDFEIHIVKADINELHKRSEDDAVIHMKQVAEETGQNVENTNQISHNDDINENVEVVEIKHGEDDVLEANYVGRREPEVDKREPETGTGDGKPATDDKEDTKNAKWVGKPVVDSLHKKLQDKIRQMALKNVELLRRSNRGQAKKTDNENKTKRIYVKAFPKNHDIPLAHVVPEEDTGFVEEVVFINADSHAHVVHKNKDYARLLKRDEF